MPPPSDAVLALTTGAGAALMGAARPLAYGKPWSPQVAAPWAAVSGALGAAAAPVLIYSQRDDWLGRDFSRELIWRMGRVVVAAGVGGLGLGLAGARTSPEAGQLGCVAGLMSGALLAYWWTRSEAG